MTPTKPKKATPLTDRAIAARKAPGILRDTKIRGLELRIRPTGIKSWSIRYDLGGTKQRKRKRVTLGTYPALLLADARERARTAIRAIEDGDDPQLDRKERREADRFGDLAQTYIDDYVTPEKRASTAEEYRRILKADILPHWRDRRVRDITRGDVRKLVADIKKRAPVLANRVAAVISGIFTFAMDREIIDMSPMVRFKKPTKENPRERELTDDEIRSFWTATDTMDGPMRAFWRLRLLTGQRGKEVSSMQWADIDTDAALWTIPATIAKNGSTHLVPLSPTALTLITELPKENTYALHGARGKRQQRVSARAFAALPNFQGRDLRRTAATRMRAAGVSQFDVARVLNHATARTNITAKVYDKYNALAEKRAALDIWANKLTAILKNNPAAVISFVRPDADPMNADWPKHRAPDVDASGEPVPSQVRR